jgi:hypothetical protein
MLAPPDSSSNEAPAIEAVYGGRQKVIECTLKRVLACAFLAVAGTTMAGTIRHARVQPGLWEIAFSVNGTPSTNTYCITPEQANVMNSDPATVQVYVERAVAEENGGGCTVKHFSLEGNTISLIKACGSGQSEFTTSLVRTYYGDTAESEVVSSSGGRELHIKSTQRRIGVCP